MAGRDQGIHRSTPAMGLTTAPKDYRRGDPVP